MAKAADFGVSETEFNIAKAQASRRAELRQEFLKQRTNPFKHAAEAGYVFDSALQRYQSQKVTSFEYFKPNRRNSLFGMFAIVVPMFAYGYLLHWDRSKKEASIRSGELKYRDRYFKLC